MSGERRCGFTDKAHLRSVAYGDSRRLADRAAIYRFLQLDVLELGPHPFRGEGLVGAVATSLDPDPAAAFRRLPALDIGCGRGQYLALLAETGAPVLAADLSPGMLAAVPDGPWTTAVADMEALPCADGAFGVVVANHALYHAPDRRAAVAELRRVLHSGGVLLAATNGDGNFAEAYLLLARAATKVLGTAAPVLAPADAGFTMESGAALLTEVFGDITARRTAGRIVIGDDDALTVLRAYFASVDDEWTAQYGVDWPPLAAALDIVLAEEMDAHGRITITTSGGHLVARP